MKKIEKDILALYDGTKKEFMLQLVAFFKESQLMLTNCKHDKTEWHVSFNGCNLCKLWLKPNDIFVSFFLSYLQEEYRGEFGHKFETCMQQHVQFCYTCHDGCTSSMDVPIFGKELTNVCSQHTINFTQPDLEDFDVLAHIKTLVGYCKTVTPNDVSYHVHN